MISDDNNNNIVLSPLSLLRFVSRMAPYVFIVPSLSESAFFSSMVNVDVPDVGFLRFL